MLIQCSYLRLFSNHQNIQFSKTVERQEYGAEMLQKSEIGIKRYPVWICALN